MDEMRNKYEDVLTVLERIHVDMTSDINKMKRLDEVIVKRKLADLRLGFQECLALVEKLETLE